MARQEYVDETVGASFTTHDGRPMSVWQMYLTMLTSRPERWYDWPRYRVTRFYLGILVLIEMGPRNAFSHLCDATAGHLTTPPRRIKAVVRRKKGHMHSPTEHRPDVFGRS